MGTRALDWDDLLDLAQRPNAADRRITVASLPALVKRSRGTDSGFAVVADAAEYAADEHWALRTEREVILLRHLLAAGQVTADDGQPDGYELGDYEVVNNAGVVIRTYRLCLVCGADESRPHDPDRHDRQTAHDSRED